MYLTPLAANNLFDLFKITLNGIRVDIDVVVRNSSKFYGLYFDRWFGHEGVGQDVERGAVARTS